MNIAMHIMSIQHQLVLAIDKDPDLKNMLHPFLTLCNLSLNSTNCHIFFVKDDNNNPTYQLDNKSDIALKHYLSVPMRKNGLWSNEDKPLLNLVNQFFQTDNQAYNESIGSTLYYLFKIGNTGSSEKTI